MTMTEKDKIKKQALAKLDGLVKDSLKYLEDSKQGLKAYNLEIPEGYFTKEEADEITNSIKQATNEPKTYCTYRGIESTILN